MTSGLSWNQMSKASIIRTRSSSCSGGICSRYSRTRFIFAICDPPAIMSPFSNFSPHAIKVGVGYPRIEALSSVLQRLISPLFVGSRMCSRCDEDVTDAGSKDARGPLRDEAAKSDLRFRNSSTKARNAASPPMIRTRLAAKLSAMARSRCERRGRDGKASTTWF